MRDRIPDIISAAGREPVTRTLDKDEFVAGLKAMLVEEAQEVSVSRPEGLAVELADVLEVVTALVAALDTSMAEIERIRQKRAQARGRFVRRVFLIETREEG